MAISDKPWSNFTAADYTPEQWRRACIVDTGEGDPSSKSRYKVPILEPDGTLNRNGVHAAAGGHGIGAVTGISDQVRTAAAKKLMSAYGQLKEDPPPSLMDMAGMSMSGRSQVVVQVPMTYRRVFPVEDIKILSRAKGGGDGRTVEAYAAVFNVPAEIHDQHGDYMEEIDPVAFNRTINSGAARRASVLLNHGYDNKGRTGGMQQTELGSPVDITADPRGLLTVSRYNDGPFTEQVLAGIRNGDYAGQSFQGPIFRSNPQGSPGKAGRAGRLPKVRRLELGLHNYGPTKNPYYPQAEILAVRSAAELAEDFAHLDADEREDLIRTLSTTPGWDPETAAILATPHRGPGAEDSRDAHSVRSRLLRLKSELTFNGVR